MSFLSQLDAWLASLHPALANVSAVQLVSTLILSWLGMRAIVGPERPRPRRRTLAEVREILDAAKRRRKGRKS